MIQIKNMPLLFISEETLGVKKTKSGFKSKTFQQLVVFKHMWK